MRNLSVLVTARTISIASLLLALSSCSPQDRSRGTIISASEITNSNLTPAEKSEELAKAGEELLTAQGFQEAREFAELSLKNDPNNLRASFIKATTGPLVLQKGILARVRGLAEKTAKTKAALEKQISDLQNSDNKNLVEFLLSGQPDINTEAQLQAHLDSTIESLDQLREFARANLKSELTVKATSLLVPDIVERYAAGCEIKLTDTHEYELTCPSETERFYVTINGADFGGIQGMASYIKTYLVLASAYDLSGTLETSAPLIKSGGKLNAQQLADELVRLPSFGRLRDQNRFADLKAMGLDLVRGLNWAMSNQAELCPKGQTDARNRLGKLLFHTGLCLPAFFKPYVDIIETFMNGQPQELITQRNDREYITQQRGVVLFTNPIRDLRDLGPWKFNSCNDLESVRDGTLGGAFPNGDFIKVLEVTSSGCNTPAPLAPVSVR